MFKIKGVLEYRLNTKLTVVLTQSELFRLDDGLSSKPNRNLN